MNPCQPCAQPCTKVLACGHTCSGYCGEECVCIECGTGELVRLPKEDVGEIQVQVLPEGGGTCVTQSSSEPERDEEVTAERPNASVFSLIKLPGCGHVLLAADIEKHTRCNLEGLTDGQVLACPACNTMVMEWDLPRFRQTFRDLHCSQQAQKEAFVLSTTVTVLIKQKIYASMEMLTHDAEARRSFASALSASDMENGFWDANRAFTVINQTRLTRVAEMLETMCWDGRMAEDLKRLQEVLLKPVRTMSAQRCRQLTEETRRLAFTAVLRFCEPLLPSRSKERHDIGVFLGNVTSSQHQFPVSEARDLALRSKRKLSSRKWKRHVALYFDLRILDAALDQHLCDILAKPKRRLCCC